MKISIKKYESLTGFKLDVTKMSIEERIKVENATRDSFLQKLHKCFSFYYDYMDKHQNGEITETQFNEAKDIIFDESGYEDIYDFYEDFIRWKNGLPIYIKFTLI